MKPAFALLAMIVALPFLVAQQVASKKVTTSDAARSPETSANRFNPSATSIVGASNTLAIAVSADGKRVASVGGGSGAASGFVSVMDVASKKELLSIRLPRSSNSVAISPNGKLVAFAGSSGDLTLLEVDGGKTLFSKKLDGPAHVGFAPDGQSLATATLGKTVQIWDVPSGDEQTKFLGATVPLYSIAYSRDGKKLAAGGGEQLQNDVVNGAIFVWNVATKRLLQKLESNPPAHFMSIAFSPDGTLVAGASIDRQAHIWDLANAKIKTTLAMRQQLFGLAFAPGGTIAGAMSDGSIRLWDSASGEEVGSLKGHIGLCFCLAFTAGGKQLASGGSARSVKLWDFADKKEVATLRQDERVEDLPVPLAMAATRDGSLIALATEDKGVVLRDGRTGEVKTTLKGHEDAITCVAFSPDDKTLASGSADKTIKLWDVATAKERATIRGHTNWVYALAFSHDGKTLASGAYDKTVRLWDPQTGKELGVIEAHRGSVRAVAFSPDDKTIASGGSDRFVKCWNLSNRELKFAEKGHEGAVRALAFSSDGKTLASGSEDGFVKLWNPATGKELVATKKEHNEEVTAIAFAGDRLLLSGGSDGVIRQWDATTGQMISAMQGHTGGVSGIAVATGGTTFISTGTDRLIKRFRQDSSGPVRQFVGHTGVVQSASFSPDGKRFVSCGSWPEGDKTLRVWEVETGKVILKIDQSSPTPMAAYSPDGKFILTAGTDKVARLWDAETGQEVRKFTGHTDALGGVAFSTDGRHALTSGHDKTMRLWEVATGQQLRVFVGHNSLVRRCAFHPDGKHAFSAGRDGLVRMWELETGIEVKQFKSSNKWADCLAVSKDGKYLATAGQIIFVYDIASGKLVTECAGHYSGVVDLVFSDDSKRILSGSYDRNACLWDRQTGKQLYKFRGHREFVWCATFSPDGQWILTGGGGVGGANGKWGKGSDHAVRLWKMPDENAIAEFSPEN